MEKIIYMLWAREQQNRLALNTALLGKVAASLAPHVLHLRLNMRDKDVEDGSSPVFPALTPSPDAVVQIWVHTAYPPRRVPIEAILREAAGRVEGWLVSESTPMPNVRHPPVPGKRTEGFSQIAVLLPTPGMSHAAWQHAWQDSHTQPAIDLQSTFEYVQNLVVRALTPDAPDIWAIVEECFPYAALTDRTLYFGHPGDAVGADANEAAMLRSVANFISASGCECFPSSQYDLK